MLGAAFAARAQTLRPPSIPASGAYLGAWVNPAHENETKVAGAIELAQLPLFQAEIGRPMSILHLFIAFNYADTSATALLGVLTRLEATGAVPMIDLACGDIDAINAGHEDATLTNLANVLAGHGKPLFLRWYWEMNLPHPQCESQHYPKYAGFIAAWRRLHGIFRRAPNVALVWCPLAPNGDGLRDDYYPGDPYVDWIGADAFYRDRDGSDPFAGRFQDWYDQYYTTPLSEGRRPKPLLLGATGSVPFGQRQWLLGQIQQELPRAYPGIKAVLYFDSLGQKYVPGQTLVLAGSGLAAFKTLAATPYFSYFDDAPGDRPPR